MEYNAPHTSRTFYWLEERAPKMANAFALFAFAAYYQEDADLRDPETVAAIAAVLGAKREHALAAISASEVKEHFRAMTEEALRKGVFRSPFFLVDGEPFGGWGRLPMVEDWLSLGGW